MCRLRCKPTCHFKMEGVFGWTPFLVILLAFLSQVRSEATFDMNYINDFDTLVYRKVLAPDLNDEFHYEKFIDGEMKTYTVNYSDLNIRDCNRVMNFTRPWKLPQVHSAPFGFKTLKIRFWAYRNVFN